MLINADFSQRVVINPNQYNWLPDMTHGLERAIFERIGVEFSKSTHLLRYAPFTDYLSHPNSHSEEVLVVAGEFSDELGRYTAGTYLRYPAGARYSPRIGAGGAILLVKQNQFQDHDMCQKNCTHPKYAMERRTRAGDQSHSTTSIWHRTCGFG